MGFFYIFHLIAQIACGLLGALIGLGAGGLLYAALNSTLPMPDEGWLVFLRQFCLIACLPSVSFAGFLMGFWSMGAFDFAH